MNLNYNKNDDDNNNNKILVRIFINFFLISNILFYLTKKIFYWIINFM